MEEIKNIICSKCKQIKKESDFNNSEKKAYYRCRDCVRLAKKSDIKMPRELDLDETNILINTWQGGKYKGHILDKNNTFYPRVDGKQKSFRYDDKNKNDIYILANKWRKEKSDELKLTSNKYKIIFEDNIPKYLIIQLSKEYITLVDFNQLEFIKSHNLCVSRSSNKNAKQYVACCVDNKLISLHGYLTGFKMVVHINGYPLDNRRINLREINSSENNKNRSVIHKTYYIKKDNKYEGNIVYNDNTQYFKKVIISELFDNLENCKKWILDKTNELNKNIFKNISNKEILKKEFEDIMEKYSDGFKWKDNDCNEITNDELIIEKINNANANNKKIIKKNIDKEDNKLNITKKVIYDQFKLLYNNWIIPENFINSSKIEHIIHNDTEYKFCTKCDNWKTIDNYYKCNSKHDGLDGKCKECSKKYKYIIK